MENGISIGKGIVWTLVWLGFMLLYTALDIGIWGRLSSDYGCCYHVFSIALCITSFLILLRRKNHFQIKFFYNTSLFGVILALNCSILFYFLLDNGLDPILERFFPTSEESYQHTLQSLSATPMSSLLQVCVLAPIIEETLMRRFLLNGFSIKYGKPKALFASALLFALLHFNMVQTLSAFICGIVLGLLYLYTGSTFCCILAHSGYNLISYVMLMLPLHGT